MRHLNLNSIFIHGFFETSEVFEPRSTTTRIGRKKLQIGGNNIQVYKYCRSYTVNLIKNIETFLNITKLREAIAEELEKWSKWKIKKITAQITNFQASATFAFCGSDILCECVIPHLIELCHMDNRIRFGKTFSTPATDSIWAFEYKPSIVADYGFITLHLTDRQQVKFQLNRKKNKVHVTLILDKFDEQVKTLCEEIEFIASKILYQREENEQDTDANKKKERKKKEEQNVIELFRQRRRWNKTRKEKTSQTDLA